MLDLHNLLPHSKKEAKIEKTEISQQINELCSINNCNNVLYFESRKKKLDLYMWMAKSPNGPSAKFLVENIHTSEELRMTGNSLKGSRPLLSFDAEFEEKPHFKVIKQLLIETFGIPNNHPKSKPFYDHVLAFNIADNRIWFRNYQIIYNQEEKDLSDVDLVEIGPRFALNPIKIFDGTLSGVTLFQNGVFKAPAAVRRDKNNARKELQAKKVGSKRSRKEEQKNLSYPEDELDTIFRDDIVKKKKKNGARAPEEVVEDDQSEENLEDDNEEAEEGLESFDENSDDFEDIN